VRLAQRCAADAFACARSPPRAPTRARSVPQVGNALPNEWLFQAALSVQLLGNDGAGCVYAGSGVSTWYGDGGSASAPQLGLFFGVNATLVPNPAGAGVGYDASNVAAAAACAATNNCTVTPWIAVPSGAQSWYSNTYPAPYFTLPPSAWPACAGSTMSFNGRDFAASAYPTTAASSAAAAPAAARGLLLAATAATAALAAAAL
jgi:hypothetical protein